jgi:hypothetical protein
MPHARTRPANQQRRYGVLVGTIHDGQGVTLSNLPMARSNAPKPTVPPW